MARVSSEGFRKEQKEKGFGGDRDLPDFLTAVGKTTVVCLEFAHIRAKGTGRWGVAALMMAVDGEQKGAVHKHDMWTANQVHQLIVSGFQYNLAYENGLPADENDSDNFEPSPDLLDEMQSIASCSDQKGKDTKWLPGISPSERRCPYIVLTTEQSRDPKYLDSKWVDPIKERGTDGPYYVGDFRSVLMDTANIQRARGWFEGRCEKMVRDANAAARERSRGGGGRGGGGRDEDTGGGGGGYSDGVQF